MTNVFKKPEKLSRKTQLFEIGVEALEKAGWTVERVQRSGKSSVRKITKGRESKIVSIRTTQDMWIAFPRNGDDTGWRTLSEVDAVLAVSVDDKENPKFAKVHLIPGDEMRARFDRAYAARVKAGYTIPLGRGVWVSLYLPEAQDPVTYVGAGAALKYPAIATVPFSPDDVQAPENEAAEADELTEAGEAPLTIAEAKRRLAITFGVDPSNIKITVEG
jgi:hypothetical protein